MVERYLQGRLTADEEQAFEEAYLSDPGLLDELVLTEKLRDGVRRAGTAPGAPARAPAEPVRWRVFGSVPYAAAATVLLGVSLAVSAVLVIENRNLEMRSAAAPVQLVPLVTVRGDSAIRVDAPQNGELAVLLVDAGFAEHDDYRATLTRVTSGAAERVTRLDGLAPAYDGQVGLGVPASVLTPGDYELTLEGREAGAGFAEITRIALTVVPRD